MSSGSFDFSPPPLPPFMPGGPTWIVVVAFITAFLLAFGIGANDVANSFATSVGSKTLTLFQACVCATFAEFAGAVLLGGQVAATIQNSIIQSHLYEDEPAVFMLGMTTALMSTAIWLILATYLKLPVSGTHAIVSAIIGFTLVAKGPGSVNWWEFGRIVLSWIISPLLAGFVSIIVYAIIRWAILNRMHSFEVGLKSISFIYGLTLALNMFPVVQQIMNAVGEAYPYYSSEICSGIGVCFASWLSTIIAFTVGGLSGVLAAIVARWIIVPRTRAFVSSQDLLFNEDLVELLPVSFLPSPSKDELLDTATIARLQASIQSTPSTPQQEFAEAIDHHNKEGEVDDTDLSRPESHLARPFSIESMSVEADTRTSSAALSSDDDDLIQDRSQRDERCCSCLRFDINANVNSDTEQQQTEKLFTALQVLTAIFGSFVHGSNDVSNAIGPLAAVFYVWQTGTIVTTSTPIWILAYGGVGIIIGLALLGRRVIETLGTNLTALTPSRGFAVETGSALTVLMASRVGIPVSTTHCKVGSIVAVGYFSNDGAVSWRLFWGIFVSWAATIPFAGLLSAGLFAALQGTV